MVDVMNQHTVYTFGPFSTKYNEYTTEAHIDLSAQARSAGWHCVDCNISQKVQVYGMYTWLRTNNLFPLTLSYLNKVWFEREEDAILFKLTWC